jgi:hypothetical protein
MESVRGAWTDERLDDLNHRVNDGFKEMRTEFVGLRRDMGEDNALIHQELGDVHRAIHQFAFAMVGTVFLGFCGTIAALISLT